MAAFNAAMKAGVADRLAPGRRCLQGPRPIRRPPDTSMTTPSTLIQVMIKAARKAGRKLARDFGEVAELQVSRKRAGRLSSPPPTPRPEQVLFEALSEGAPRLRLPRRGARPGSRAPTRPTRWIIDPLDGTTNFLHAIPHFATTIALEREGVVVAGVTYNPITNETVLDREGQGRLSQRQAAARRRPPRPFGLRCWPPASPSPAARATPSS